MNEPVQVGKKIWEGDQLGRKTEGEYLRNYITRLYGVGKKDQSSFVLNINSEWGHGKTWFLTELAKELGQNHPVVYFDAWKNDFSNDALLSFVSVVCDELSKLFWKDKSISKKINKVKSIFSSLSKSALPILLSVLAKQLTGKALDDLGLSEEIKDACVDASDELSKVVSTSAIDSFLTQRNAIDDFSKAVESLVKEIEVGTSLHLPICIMVDELDRCRPTYAIELLEAIKHLFATRGIFFILATDTKQLSHSIKAVYGEGFNALAYLKRFFYAEYVLADPDYEKFSKYLFDQAPGVEGYFFLPKSLNEKYGLFGMFARISELFRLTARDQEQVFKVIENIVISSERETTDFMFLTFLACLKHKFPGDYVHQLHCKNSTQILEFFKKEVRNQLVQDLGVETIDRMEGGDRPVVVSFREVFEHYFSLLDGDLNNPKLVASYLGHVWKQELAIKITKNAQTEYRSNKYVGSHDLSSYFELLDQVGRGKINLTLNDGE